MSEYHFPVPGHEDDKIIVFTRHHWASFLGKIFLVGFLLILPIIVLLTILFVNRQLLSGLINNFVAVAVSIYYFVMTTLAYIEWVSYYYDVFIVTEDEIIDIVQQGIFDRQITEISILRVQDVTAHSKGFLPTLFGYGDVIAESAGEKTQTYVIDCVPNPVELANKILDLHNAQIAKEQRTAEVMHGEGDLRPGKIETIPPPAPAASPPPPSEISPPAVSRPPQSEEEGNISKDDLNKGGEVKF